MSAPLAGCRVIDFGSYITGPFTAMLLGDLGAEVIKIERPGTGDPFRSFEQGLYGPQYKAFNRNKASLVLDLAGRRDQGLMRRLVAASDVFVVNARPGAMARLGLDHETLARINPRLVYCAITGFGADGPAAGRPAYDTVAQAASGFLGLFVSADDSTVKGPAVADAATALYAANGVLAALFERHRTGRGRLVEVAMMAAMAHFASEPFQHFFTRGTLPPPEHRAQISQSFVFACADGRLIAVHLSSSDRFWRGLLVALGREALGADPRFATRMSRIGNHAALEQELSASFGTRPRSVWLERLAAQDVPHAPVHDLAEALADPQARHLGIEQRSTHPTEGEVHGIASPILFDRARPAAFRAPPTLDEDGERLRAWLASLPDPD